MWVGVLDTPFAVVTEKWRNSVKNKNLSQNKKIYYMEENKKFCPMLISIPLPHNLKIFRIPFPFWFTAKQQQKANSIRPDVSQITLRVEVFHENY